MTLSTKQIFKVCSLSMAIIGSTAIVAAISAPDMAYAKSGNGNGGGNGNGNGNGGGGGNKASGGGNKASGGGNTNGGTNSKSSHAAIKKSAATAETVEEAEDDAVEMTKAKTFKTKKQPVGGETVAHPSELGALNAAHASPNALANANPNSRVGRIALFRDAVVAGQELEAELKEKSLLLDSLTQPKRTAAEIEVDLALANEDVATEAGAVAKLKEELELAGGTDTEIEADLKAATDALAIATADAAALSAEKAAASEYETLTAEVKTLTQQVEDQPKLERSLLEDAANKPVTDEVEAAVEALLGL